MKRNLDHLPASRQKHLEDIVAIIRDEFEQVTGFANGKKKHSKILKIILFGSHATGKWVNDPANGYVSDYDVLVILNRDDLIEEYKIWSTIESRVSLRVRPPLNLIVHTLSEVNNALKNGHYFFTDIQKQGIFLYESDRTELVQGGKLSPEEARPIAEKHYAHWFDGANGFYIMYKHAMTENLSKIAAFQLHQAAERYYSCFLLVTTNYKPNTQNLTMLNSMCITQNESFTSVFPQDTKIHRRRFQLLKSAYIDARYSEHYEITKEELEWCAERVILLQQLTEKLCQEKIQSFV